MQNNKTHQLLIILILAFLAALLVYPSRVLAKSNPSVPNFSVQYVDHSYVVPITHWTTTDPYTGNQITHTSGGEHIDNRTIDLTITNQPFTPYKDTNNNTIQLYYNVRSKGHFEQWNGDSDFGSHSVQELQASTSTYTVVSFNIEDWGVSIGGQIDFEVEAVTAYVNYNIPACERSYQTTVGNSGWSNTQTITIGSPTSANQTAPPISTPTPIFTQTQPTFNPNNPTATPLLKQNPTAKPIEPGAQAGALFGFDWVQTSLIVMAVVIAVLVVALVLVMWRKKSG